MKTKFSKKRGESGFTIAELLVAMSIFVVLVTIATGAFIQALRSEKRLLSLMSISNNASLVLEQMAREIRTGYSFPTQSACGASLSFDTSASGNISYGLGSAAGRGIIKRNGQDLTAANVNVSNLCFLVSRGTNVCNPWRVTIRATVDTFPSSASVKPITIQTSASSRVLPRDIPLIQKSQSQYRYCE